MNQLLLLSEKANELRHKKSPRVKLLKNSIYKLRKC